MCRSGVQGPTAAAAAAAAAWVASAWRSSSKWPLERKRLVAMVATAAVLLACTQRLIQRGFGNEDNDCSLELRASRP